MHLKKWGLSPGSEFVKRHDRENMGYDYGHMRAQPVKSHAVCDMHKMGWQGSYLQCITRSYHKSVAQWWRKSVVFAHSECSARQIVHAFQTFSSKGVLCRTLDGHAHWVNTLALSSDYVIRTGAFDPKDATIVKHESSDSSKLNRRKSSTKWINFIFAHDFRKWNENKSAQAL